MYYKTIISLQKNERKKNKLCNNITTKFLIAKYGEFITQSLNEGAGFPEIEDAVFQAAVDESKKKGEDK